MDKDWVHFDRSTDEYMHAALNFVEMANRNTGNLEKIICPCKCCRNLTHHTGKDVYEHLVINGMDPMYTTWFHHGEEPTAAQKSKQVEMSEAHNLYSAAYTRDADHLEPLDEARDDNFAKELEDAETPLYPGCENYTKLIHVEELKKSNPSLGLQKNRSLLLKRHADNFPKWLKEKIQVKSCTDNELEKLQWLANGPRKHAMSYTGYIINGQRFHTKEAEKSTQNSGVSIDATTMCRSSAKDNAQVIDVVSYYGVIKDIVLLDYYTFQLPMFKCDWANIGHGVKFEDGFTLVNLHQGQTQYEKEPFVLASQAKQVFYSRDTDTSNWYVVLKAPPRGFYDMEMYEETVDSRPQDVSALGMNIDDDDDENITNVRGDDEGTLL